MKKSLFVAVALSVFTVSAASAQSRINFVKNLQFTPEGIVYNPPFAVSAPVKRMVSALAVATEMCSPLQFKYAQILNREVESLTNLPLFNFIEDWWGTRYRFGGSTKKGIDCSSFTGLLLNAVFGVSLPRTAREQYAVSQKIRQEDLQEGDLVFFNTRGGVSHVGVYLSGGYFVHSSCSNGVTISNLGEAYYSKKFIAGGRPTVADECVEGGL